ncbi:LamG domain-containing protein [Gordonia westfalica]|uniref:LamG domain-containing protein n=1 Tax=Gordonia westfalica TaxID=158898 RepID=A0ABU2GV09_9ACTN|nr:LamG domain-containing protein [Gordonia westfalica]MDS1115273.1 LamG domain-containing protein [Gordonia westfalica]
MTSTITSAETPYPVAPDWMRITAYGDKWSVQQGERINFYVNCDGPAEYDAQLVQLINGNTDPAGPGLKEIPADAPFNGTHVGRKQVINSGSYVLVPNRAPLDLESFTIQAYVWPTMPHKVDGYWRPGPQAIVSKSIGDQGYGLFINDDAEVELRINGDVVTSGAPLRDHAWTFIAATYDAATGEVVLYQEPQIQYALDPQLAPTTATITTPPARTDVPLTIGAAADRYDDGPAGVSSVPVGLVMGNHYNGKIDSVRIASRALSRLEIEQLKGGANSGTDERRSVGPTGGLAAALVATWDFGKDIPTRRAHDDGPYKLHGDVINLPTRAMTGYNWSGKVTDWRLAPEQYGAIHFHDDDVDDARWAIDFSFDVPAHLKSAVWAVKLTSSEGDEDYVPFIVRPPLGAPTAKIAVILSTQSYMAYANEHLAANAGAAELLVYRVPMMQEQNMFLAEHREYGGSIYDTHTDGSGICLSSRLRPVLSFRPRYDHFLAQAPWQFPADLHLIDWLTEMGYDFDVITDEDVSYDGLERIEGYNVLLTGTHPEHHDGHYLDNIQMYKERGGRFMYMGGDGFYWIHTFHPAYERGEVTEMRRCESGIRTWRADPGEYHHQSTGDLGGMWRFVGRYLHAIGGTGMSAEGFDIGTYYTRTPESNDPRVSWAFEGIDFDERIGDFGLVSGGAAGLEVDIVDTTLGSPPHTLLTATSAGRHTEGMLLVMEDYGFSQAGIDGTHHPRVRSDIAFHETPNGGACFAFSSIAFCGSLSHNGYANNISKLVGNVLDRFSMDGPLPAPDPSNIISRGRADYDTALNTTRADSQTPTGALS